MSYSISTLYWTDLGKIALVFPPFLKSYELESYPVDIDGIIKDVNAKMQRAFPPLSMNIEDMYDDGEYSIVEARCFNGKPSHYSKNGSLWDAVLYYVLEDIHDNSGIEKCINNYASIYFFIDERKCANVDGFIELVRDELISNPDYYEYNGHKEFYESDLEYRRNELKKYCEAVSDIYDLVVETNEWIERTVEEADY